MLLFDLAQLSARLSETQKRLEKTALIAGAFARTEHGERGLLATYLSGSVRQAKLGVGPGQLRALGEVGPCDAPALSLRDVDQALTDVAQAKGSGSGALRTAMLRDLFARATAPEQRFLARLLLGELRQGALQSLVLDAIAQAARVAKPRVQRAQMLSGDIAQVAELAFEDEGAGLLRLDITLFRPVLPMLAEPARDLADALERLGRAAFELKLDGARVQVHRREDEVRVFSRALNDVTGAVPELVELVRSFPARELIVDGEAIALQPDGTPRPFQETMRRFGRRLDVPALRAELPLSVFFFDCLLRDGRSLLHAPTEERVEQLSQIAPEAQRVPRLVSDDLQAATAFLQSALERGHEGILAKSLTAPYAAGARGAHWLKIKLSHTLDLVVLAAEWGSGRRKGSLSNLHLGARDPETGGFVMLGKTFKGLTDEMLRLQTSALLACETHRDAYTVYVRPELVVEVAFNGVQTSPQYPGGLALRFARVKRYRPDKSPADVDTLAQVRAIHAASVGGHPGRAEPPTQ